MRLWTIQDIEIINDIEQNGYAYCNQEGWMYENCHFAYDWLAEEMSRRIGPPPLPDIKLPLWAWQQYTSSKKPRPPKSPALFDSEKTEQLFLEIDVPDSEVILSDFDLWGSVLNGWNIVYNKRLEKKIDSFVKDSGTGYNFIEYPDDIKSEIMDSWDRIFDFSVKDKWYMGRLRRNRVIQATFWLLKKEYIIDVSHIKR